MMTSGSTLLKQKLGNSDNREYRHLWVCVWGGEAETELNTCFACGFYLKPSVGFLTGVWPNIQATKRLSCEDVVLETVGMLRLVGWVNTPNSVLGLSLETESQSQERWFWKVFEIK